MRGGDHVRGDGHEREGWSQVCAVRQVQQPPGLSTQTYMRTCTHTHTHIHTHTRESSDMTRTHAQVHVKC